ncbi:MAG: methyltransferase domain-containing protein [Deltaproteobacteria bacterium]|nr:methyltransferase domain-containing protein [Deltaproteobacteria bacterium]
MSDEDPGRPWMSRIERLEQPVETLEQARAELSALLEIKAHRNWVIEGLQDHVANLEADLERALQRIEDLETHTRNVENDNKSLCTHVENLEREVANRDTRVAELEGHVENIDNWVTSWRQASAESAGRTPEREGSPVGWQTDECRRLFDGNSYYADAENDMTEQWEKFIEPAIARADFESVLELAPGHGRNTERLLARAGSIHLVDVNQSCIDACRRRFDHYAGPCKLYYHVNNGHTLQDVAAEIISFVYSWDSAVHFYRLVIRDYMLEFARIMKKGATGFVHHSNYGVVSESSEWTQNPAWRSNMTAELFVEYCGQAGLEIIDQQIIDWMIKGLDCISTFRKSA